MTPLKVKCTICMKEEIPSPGVLSEISGMIEKYNLTNEQYLHFLNVMNGKCLNSNEHSFEFDEEFLTSINKIVEQYKANLEETEKLRNNQRDLIKEIQDVEIKLKELRSLEESVNTRLENVHKNFNGLRTELKDSTGLDKIEIWNI